MDWVQCFGVFMAIISCKEPQSILDLIGYQSLIIQFSHHCQEGCWVIYDRRFRLKTSSSYHPRMVMYRHNCVEMAFPERPPAGGFYLAIFKPPHQLFNSQAISSANHICLAWNESPNPECLRPFCNFDYIIDESIPMLLTRSIRLFSTLIGRNALANQKPGQITSGILHEWSIIRHNMLTN